MATVTACRRHAPWLLVAAMETCLVFAAAPRAQAPELLDGTPVHLRLLGAVTSDNARVGQTLDFVVVSDVRVGEQIVIRKGTAAFGRITDARRASWEYFHKHPRLAFKFTLTTAQDGAAIALRASPHRGGEDRVVLDHGDHRQILWAGESNTFDAYVSGNYGVRD